MEQRFFTVKFLGQAIDTWYITERETALDALKILNSQDILFGIDTETAANPEFAHIKTAALSPLLSRIRLLQVYDGECSYVFDLDTINDSEIFIPFLETKRFVGHNAIFDLGFFRRMGVRHIDIGCTRIMYKLVSHAVYPTDSGLSASLSALAEKILGTDILKKLQASNWANPDLTFEQLEYAGLDPVIVHLIEKKLSIGIRKMKMKAAYKLNCDVQHPICDMQLNGMLLDAEKHSAAIVSWREDLFKSRKALKKFTGLKKITDMEIGKWLEENLPGEILAVWPRTEGSKDAKKTKAEKEASQRLSTSAHAFADFSFLEIVEPISTFKRLEKLCSSFGDSLLHLRSQSDGRLHSSFNICGARTGRLSSSKPNLQQYPNDEDLRTHFIASPGCVLVCADFSQIEVRVAAEISGDQEMLRVYRDGLDIYSATAARLSGKPIESLGKESRERKIAKALILGTLFGLGTEKFIHYGKKGGFDVSYEDAVDYFRSFRDLYKGLRAWQVSHAAECKRTLSVSTIGGKLRKLAPDTYYGAGLNHPVQGTAYEVNARALTLIHEGVKGTGVKIINSIHDETVIDCPVQSATQVGFYMRDCMISAYQEFFPTGVIRDLANVFIGPSWGEQWLKLKGNTFVDVHP